MTTRTRLRRLSQTLAAAFLIAASATPFPVSAAGDALPTTLPGGSVIETGALAQLTRQNDAVLIDVGPAPRRPDDKPGPMPWLPPPHRSLPKSVWIPGAGTGTVPAPIAQYFRTRLAQLTRGDRDRRIIVYCHPNCLMSWNAAERAVAEGYRRVTWYPGGVEAWQEAGLPTTITKPEGPDAK